MNMRNFGHPWGSPDTHVCPPAVGAGLSNEWQDMKPLYCDRRFIIWFENSSWTVQNSLRENNRHFATLGTVILEVLVKLQFNLESFSLKIHFKALLPSNRPDWQLFQCSCVSRAVKGRCCLSSYYLSMGWILVSQTLWFLCLVWHSALDPLTAGGASSKKTTNTHGTILRVEHQDFEGSSSEE